MQQYKCQQHEQLSMACTEQQFLAAVDLSCLCMHMSSNSHDNIAQQSVLHKAYASNICKVSLYKLVYDEGSQLLCVMHDSIVKCRAVHFA
jgi:hypothetical protein